MARIRLFVIVGVAAGYGLWWGGHNVKLGVEEREPLEISCADYLAQKPSARYLRLTGCQPDLDNIAMETDLNDHTKVSEVYVPLRPIGQTGAPHIVLVRNDAAICQAVRHSEMSLSPTEEEREVIDTLTEPQEGVVQFGMSLSEGTRNELDKLGLGLAPDFVMIDEGAEPHLWLGLAACAASLFAFARLLTALLRRFRN